VIEMAIQEGDFVKLSYTGGVNGRIFDTTDEEEAKTADIHNPQALYGPMVVRAGSHHIILGLDEALIGKDEGFEGDLEISPEKGFGLHDPKRIESFPKNKFKEKPVKGMSVKVEELGEGVVIDVIGGRVIVDFNHPLSGKTLNYHMKIESVVEDLIEKVKGLIHLYAGRDMEISFADGNLTITLPPGINYDRRWVMWRSRVIHESFEFIPDIKEIILVESFKRPEKSGEEVSEE
jgi:FKBP-type peptidyl-prolyl cis-trans isomerase SlyD